MQYVFLPGAAEPIVVEQGELDGADKYPIGTVLYTELHWYSVTKWGRELGNRWTWEGQYASAQQHIQPWMRAYILLREN